ncbi:peptidoglycan-binding domain-containing protein [Bifidobacterium oedipodis]|uniref:Peptidoglycan-binding protein n=1 Tax=Bifidobacterium oedipodis TaxID=2675322 RepID=A0A7Y0ENZ6_9BIFI|nr:peptidoglycan-binding protein [Bifidobacterium sp. DSM 109957]NMM93759.1 peptidoglycan-binding protein [Bifidobacterium sp. DSM 109957]
MPDTVETSHQKFTDERTVEITFENSAEQSVIGRMSGTVSANLCIPGQVVESGNQLMSVDGRPIIALHTSTPLYRDISIGDAGPDVMALQQELARLGYNTEGNGNFGWRTANGVSQLLERAGRNHPAEQIGPTDTIWIPDATVIPTQCLAPLNTALSDGTEIMKTGGQLTAVTFPLPSDLREGKRRLTLFGVATSIDDVADSTITDQTFLNEVTASDEYKTFLADQGGKKPTATLALEQPIDTIQVPPSAIVGQSGNRACVSPNGKRVVPVTVIGSSLGVALIQPDQATIDINKVVLGQRLDGLECPASVKQ